MSLVYAECKKLAERGLATRHREHHGNRPRTVYTVTDDGRSRAQLLDNLKTIRTDAERMRDDARAQVRDYAETGGPYPERLPVIALTGKVFFEYAELLARWATLGRGRRHRMGRRSPRRRHRPRRRVHTRTGGDNRSRLLVSAEGGL